MHGNGLSPEMSGQMRAGRCEFSLLEAISTGKGSSDCGLYPCIDGVLENLIPTVERIRSLPFGPADLDGQPELSAAGASMRRQSFAGSSGVPAFEGKTALSVPCQGRRTEPGRASPGSPHSQVMGELWSRQSPVRIRSSTLNRQGESRRKTTTFSRQLIGRRPPRPLRAPVHVQCPGAAGRSQHRRPAPGPRVLQAQEAGSSAAVPRSARPVP
jgi:hypothetical protein